MSRPARSVLVAALLTACALLVAAPAPATLLDHEYIAAYDQLGRLRMLAQRISKQNLLYQLHLADQHKLELLDTVNKFNDTLKLLREGSPMVGMPVPPTPEIHRQLVAIGESWKPLESMALASPYDYLRQSREFINPKNARGDPLLILHFDQMAERLTAEIEKCTTLYIAECEKDGYQHCGLGELSGLPDMRAERLIKQAVLVYAGMDPKANEAGLERMRAELRDAILLSDESAETTEARAVLDQARAEEIGPQAQAIRDLTGSVVSSWRRLDREIELVGRGHAEEANLRRALDIQRLLVGDLQRLSVAVRDSGVYISVR